MSCAGVVVRFRLGRFFSLVGTGVVVRFRLGQFFNFIPDTSPATRHRCPRDIDIFASIEVWEHNYIHPYIILYLRAAFAPECPHFQPVIKSM